MYQTKGGHVSIGYMSDVLTDIKEFETGLTEIIKDFIYSMLFILKHMTVLISWHTSVAN